MDRTLPPALVMHDTSTSSILSGRTYYLLCPGGSYLSDPDDRITRFETEQAAMDAARERGWEPIADSTLSRFGRAWSDAHAAVCAWRGGAV